MKFSAFIGSAKKKRWEVYQCFCQYLVIMRYTRLSFCPKKRRRKKHLFSTCILFIYLNPVGSSGSLLSRVHSQGAPRPSHAKCGPSASLVWRIADRTTSGGAPQPAQWTRQHVDERDREKAASSTSRPWRKDCSVAPPPLWVVSVYLFSLPKASYKLSDSWR